MLNCGKPGFAQIDPKILNTWYTLCDHWGGLLEYNLGIIGGGSQSAVLHHTAKPGSFFSMLRPKITCNDYLSDI